MAIKKMTKKQQEKAAERREGARQYLAEAVEAAQGEAGFKKWVEARSKVIGVRLPAYPGAKVPAPYSLNNQLIVALFLGGTQAVAGYNTWQKHGRQVRKGTEGTPLVAAGSYQAKDPVTGEKETDSSGKPVYRRFIKWSPSVFKYEDTDPIEGLDESKVTNLDVPISEPEEGDSHAHLLPILEQFAKDEGCTVKYEKLRKGHGGSVIMDTGEITINDSLAANAKVKTLIHELAHWCGKVDYQSYKRADAEVIVETVAFIVSQGLGIASDYSVGYCAIWDSRKADGKDPFKEYLRLIDNLAKKIEGALYDFAVYEPQEKVA
jgi:hypothetical protein